MNKKERNIKRTRRPYLAAAAFFLIPVLWAPLFAQGTLRGVVVDSLTSQPLIGANVFIPGTVFGSATNLQGEFTIDRIPVGRYTLKISYIGYIPKEIPVVVENRQVAQLRIPLAAGVVQGKTIVITGQAVGQAAAINQQITSNTVVNVISEEKIRELPDANAAEAMGRLPGVSIRRSGGEANKVVLRGLSDKYSTITVDGVRIAPTDENARGVDLSTVSQSSLAGIELFKALTPDKDADAIAGSINLVTKKAPSELLLQMDLKGSYNALNNAYDQYEFGLRYGDRFFHDMLGVQVNGTLERRDRSKENFNLDYNLRGIEGGNDYEITDFTLNYTDEMRTRQGIGLLLDLELPNEGWLRFNNIYNRTKRDYIEYERNYPTTGEELFYTARDREQEINTFTGALSGEHHFWVMSTSWGLSYANSQSRYPFDYQMDFVEPSTTDASGTPLSGMKAIPDSLMHGPPENFIPYALNNFDKAYLYGAYYRGEENHDVEKTAFLNLSGEYTIGKLLSGQLKLGAKYRDRARDRSRSELFSPYYNEAFAQYTDSAGVIVRKDFTGTRFEDLKMIGNSILFSNFLDSRDSRQLFGLYDLNPLDYRDALRLWWDLNRDGYSDAGGHNPEYERNVEPDAMFYDIDEGVVGAYVMNTFNVGQAVTLITGLRMEYENDSYLSKYSPSTLSGFPVPTGEIRDTSAVHEETLWLPNVHLTIRPFNFMNLRLAAYKAVARPDFNYRLANVVMKARSTFFPGNNLTVGNPNLKAAEAWNFEVNTSFFNNWIGLFSVSAFYKDVQNMFQLIDELPLAGQDALDSLGIDVISPFGVNEFVLTYPINSTRPTTIWGVEIEHQANLSFLPGFLKHFVLSYNLSFVRSETWVPTTHDTTVQVIVPPFPFPIERVIHKIVDRAQKLQGQPEFFGNFAIGYDIGGFSARLSVFHQGRFNQTFSADGRSDGVYDAFTRWDFAVKQQITKNIAIIGNVNNFTNIEEGTSTLNRVTGWDLLNEHEIYGLTADLGVRLTL